MTTRTLVLITVFVLHGALAIAQHTLLLRDEGMSKLSYINTADQKPRWQVEVPPGRDLQLIGQGRVLIGTGNGYEERDITTGQKVNESTAWQGTIAARRLGNGNTMLIGVNWQGKEGIVLVEITSKNEIARTITFPGFTYARLFRPTAKGTYLVTADKVVFE